jgi:Na+/proline symporter
MVAVAVAALIGGLDRPDSLFLLTQIGIAGLLSGTAVPVIAGYTWKRTTKRGAEASFAAGTLTYLLLFFGIIGPYGSNQFMSLLIASTIGAIVIVPVSLNQKAKSVESQQRMAFGRTGD